MAIFLHAFQMLNRNIMAAVRAVLVPFGVMFVLWFVYFWLAASPIELQANVGGQPSGSSISLTVAAFFVLLLGFLFAFGLVAGVWHRFILAEEPTTWIPKLSGLPVWPYIGRTIQIGLIFIPILIVFLLLFGRMLVQPEGVGLFGLLVSIALSILFIFLWLRFGLCLPSTALGNSMGPFTAFRKTRDYNGMILKLAVVWTILHTVSNAVIESLGINLFGTLVATVIGWYFMMLGISILTTMYGHIIENRELSDGVDVT